MVSGQVQAKLFMGILASSQEALQKAKRQVERRYGDIDLVSLIFPFDYTTYYNEEMGEEIVRQFISFHDLFDPGKLRSVKRETVAFEREMSVEGKRIVNLDPGYVNSSTVVVATTKDASYRVYLGEGVYAEAILSYRKRAFRPFEWTYRDYREEESLRFFSEVRKRFVEDVQGRGW